ncbi:rhomboid family intramembrane serine protease [Actinomadura atramentaria]|uniref:rhomboid family intramembrane serine protease n=1 Tax=Actinomadura atramentaria TaxID=1990 RepID=UPI0003A08F76|nr:rhomboid family intramembrane serine protease [Actinomadura atramentaria]
MTSDSPPAPETSVPYCYRHPGRETYVRCVRCDRYICPECMREAAVGHQCVECVNAGASAVRQPRRMPAPGRGGAWAPVVTYTLIGLCVLAYVGEIASARFYVEFLTVGLGQMPGGDIAGVATGEVYRLLTGTFLHQRPNGDPVAIIHILFNMWALWVTGPWLERELGRARFLALYLLAGLGGSVLLYVVDPFGAAVGASGAIFGLFAAFFVLGLRRGISVQPIVLVLVLNLVLTFSNSNISWQGHIGGLVVGGLIAAAYAYAPPRLRGVVGVAAPVAVAAVLVAAVLVKTAGIPGGFV